MHRAIWIWPALLTLAVVAVQIDRAPLWRDELATWSAASRPVGELVRLAAHTDAVTGPYYLLMHGWIAVFGDSVLALRLPAALCMAGTAALVTMLGARLFGARAGLIAGLLFAIVPSTSRYGQEARPYALATLLAVLATLLLARALDRPSWPRWLGYAAAVAGLGLAHLAAVSLLAGHAAAALLARRDTHPAPGTGPPVDPEPPPSRPPDPPGDTTPPPSRPPDPPGDTTPPPSRPPNPPGDTTPPPSRPPGPAAGTADRSGRRHAGPGSADRWRRWLAAVGAAALVLAPLVVLGRGQQGRQLDWVGEPGLPALSGLPGAVTQADAVGGLLFGLAAVGAASRGRCGAVLGLTILFPAALLFVGGQFTPLWVPRYLVFVVPFGCLLAAATLAPLGLRTALPIVVAGCLLGAPEQADLRRTHEWPRTAPVDYPAAARIIGAHRRPGDGIVYSPRSGWAFLDTAIAYHLRDDRPRDVLLAMDPVRRGDLWATECAEPVRCLATVDRVWLLVRGARDDPLHGLPAAKADPLREQFRVDRVWIVPGLTVALLTRVPR